MGTTEVHIKLNTTAVRPLQSSLAQLPTHYAHAQSLANSMHYMYFKFCGRLVIQLR